MLGKTANGLFWMYRGLERAENTSRLIETGQRIALTRIGTTDAEWRSVLQTAGVLDGFLQHHDAVTKEDAINWMLRAKENPSSVMSGIAAARQNARMVRTAITSEVWEAVNAGYMDAKAALSRKVADKDLPKVLGMLRQRSALVRGATYGTMLRNEIYDYSRLGTFIERADNTARILDVKYYVLLPSISAVGSSIDNVQWETILRATSARGGFRMEYGNSFDPKDIAHFLILDGRMPRSLDFCFNQILTNLKFLDSGGPQMPSYTKADMIQRRFLSHDIDAIFDFGLHEYIQELLRLIGELARQIEIDYRFYE